MIELAADYRVECTANGREALARIDVIFPDLIIADLHMPEMDGFEEALKGAEPPPRVLMISGATEAFPMLRAAGLLGASAMLQKPFSGEDLLAAISKLLERP